MLRWSSLVTLLFVFVAVSAPGAGDVIAHAQGLTDFDEAEAAYRDQRYSVASALFERVIATADTATDSVDRAVLLESRKYLAACYLFLGRPDDTDRQFELLLSEDPDHRVDPAAFPHDVLGHFESVRARFEEARAARRDAELALVQARLRDEQEALAAERARYSELYRLATSTVVLRENSRIVALLPFGVGQFQNRRRRLGRFFAVAESASLGLYVASFAWHTRLTRIDPGDDKQQLRWENALIGAQALNWASGGILLTLMVSGAIEAELNFVPTRSTTTPRPVPLQLRPESRPTARLGVMPTGLFLRVDF